MKKKEIESRAKVVLEAFPYANDDTPYVDAVRLARFFGFQVKELKNLPAIEDGEITVGSDSDGTGDIIRSITVNDNRSLESKRFIITHELSHYLLHYKGDETFFRHRENAKGKNKEENDADYLAACLLMPSEIFKKHYEVAKQNHTPEQVIDILQKTFRTPRESIIRRIDEVLYGATE